MTRTVITIFRGSDKERKREKLRYDDIKQSRTLTANETEFAENFESFR